MKMKLLKKITICGMSLLTLASIGANSANARRRGHYHYRTAKLGKIKHLKRRTNTNKDKKTKRYQKRTARKANNKYFTFSQLIKAMNYNYNNDSDKYTRKLVSTVKHNLNHYSQKQLYAIGTNADQADLYSTKTGYQLSQEIMNRYFDRAHNVNKLSKQDNTFDTQVRADLINNINHDRVDNGLKPLKVNSIAQMTANYRAPKVQYAYDHYDDYKSYHNQTSNPSDYWVHGENTHTAGSDYLDRNNYEYNVWGANACNWDSDATNGDNTPLKYTMSTPSGVADNIDNNFMNHDNSEGNYNQHRDNELDPDYQYLGVGITYNPATQEGTANEQFIG